MVCHRCSRFQRSAVFQVGGDPGRAERMVADRGFDADRGRPPADHGVRALLGRGVAEALRLAPNWGDYTKVTYLHAKGEQIRYDASRCYSQAFLPLLWCRPTGADMGGRQSD
jgi:hypothetical protein